MPWGGRRPGAGAKPKSQRQREISGVPAHRRKVVAHPSVPDQAGERSALPTVVIPDGMTPEEQKVWDQDAPFALENGTLTPATARTFRRYCQSVVIAWELALDPGRRGGSDHRGMIQRADTEALSFNLAPCGKRMVSEGQPAAAPVNPLARFLKRN
jgi:hypothetical protein